MSEPANHVGSHRQKKTITLTGSLVYSFLTFVLTALVACGFTIYYVTQQNQKCCDTLTIFDTTWKQVPPPTESGKALAAKMHELGKGFGCWH